MSSRTGAFSSFCQWLHVLSRTGAFSSSPWLIGGAMSYSRTGAFSSSFCGSRAAFSSSLWLGSGSMSYSRTGAFSSSPHQAYGMGQRHKAMPTCPSHSGISPYSQTLVSPLTDRKVFIQGSTRAAGQKTFPRRNFTARKSAKKAFFRECPSKWFHQCRFTVADLD